MLKTKKFWLQVLLFALAYGVILSLFGMLREADEFSWPRLLMSALTYGVFMAVFNSYSQSHALRKIKIHLAEGEALLRESLAIHYHKEGARFTGKLVLSTERLVFRSNPVRGQSYEESIALAQIQSAYTAKSGAWRSDLLCLKLEEGTVQFRLEAPKKWQSALETAKNTSQALSA